MSTTSTIIDHFLWNYYSILQKTLPLAMVGEVPYGDDIESAVMAGLARVSKLRQSVLRFAFEGRL